MIPAGKPVEPRSATMNEPKRLADMYVAAVLTFCSRSSLKEKQARWKSEASREKLLQRTTPALNVPSVLLLDPALTLL
jgi:hypothetical protein